MKQAVKRTDIHGSHRQSCEAMCSKNTGVIRFLRIKFQTTQIVSCQVLFVYASSRTIYATWESFCLKPGGRHVIGAQSLPTFDGRHSEPPGPDHLQFPKHGVNIVSPAPGFKMQVI